jgi:hypothetical protein
MMEHCCNCGGDSSVIGRIFTHLGLQGLASAGFAPF